MPRSRGWGGQDGHKDSRGHSLLPHASSLTPDSTPAYAFCLTPDSVPALPAGGDKDRSGRRGNWGGAQEYEAAECWSGAAHGHGPYYAPESGKGVI